MTPWTTACQAPLSMEFSRQEYWSAFPFPSPGDLPDLEIKPESPALQADSLLSATTREALSDLQKIVTKETATVGKVSGAYQCTMGTY